MPQKQTLLTFNNQYLNATYIDHFYKIDESLYRKLQYLKIYVRAVSLFRFVRVFFLENNGSDNNINPQVHLIIKRAT